jgi:hypothetical protein
MRYSEKIKVLTKVMKKALLKVLVKSAPTLRLTGCHSCIKVEFYYTGRIFHSKNVNMVIDNNKT